MMGGQWKEIVRLAFTGKRYEGNALDIDALGELVKFQAMIAETAEASWRAEHPDRKKLPAHFEERTRLCLRRIESGSAVAPMEVYVEEPEEPELFDREPTDEVLKAVDIACRVFHALEKDELLPEGFYRKLIPTYTRLGKDLKGEDESIEIIKTGQAPARVTAATKVRWEEFKSTDHQDQVDITGEVREADVQRGGFQMWLKDGSWVEVKFKPEQEEIVTQALREHRTKRIWIKGRGDFSPLGELKQVHTVEHMGFAPEDAWEYDESAPDIVDVLIELANEVPAEEWKKLPDDLLDNLDHYLYGGPKR